MNSRGFDLVLVCRRTIVGRATLNLPHLDPHELMLLWNTIELHEHTGRRTAYIVGFPFPAMFSLFDRPKLLEDPTLIRFAIEIPNGRQALPAKEVRATLPLGRAPRQGRP